ncbi:hypothetical protein Q5P01_022925 [Channa striata]|uniref:AIG1-type G domain-containing protein n=1 Tax=Channa striata TaxID=64152 RepID=A0AA88LRV5_CHASR|nr:hypothetical protein Q5P01_022925 [Channa striata]
MVLGATGAGKTTLINGMMNYILGVEWKDSYRFKLVDEGQSKSQAESQTSDVTAYRIYHEEGFKINYSLTIVDTPGFGDTRGIERDGMIVDQLRNLFTAELGVSEIDAVCFVAQAALARLTPTQKYVFDSVLSIFGKDVAENIRILVTFADGKRPPVLEAIVASETKSLTLTKEVLRERKQLENFVEKLQEQVKLGLAKLEEIKQTSEILKENEAEISRNENFEFEVTVQKPVQVDISGSGNFITNCQKDNLSLSLWHPK